MKRAVLIFCSLVVIFAGLLSHQLGHFQAGTDVSSDTDDSGYEYYVNEDANQGEDAMDSSQTDKTAQKVDMIDVDTKADSITVLVNRQYRMDQDYIPADLVVPAIRFSFYGTYEKSYVRQVTATALERLFAAAEQNGVILKGVSGYRSYTRQQEIYSRNVSTRGKTTTNLVSANPGASEHQTGLAMDVSSESVGCALEESFGDTAEGRWLAKNCHKYGFIIRYPKDKTEITGYSYEPWHIRYVGKKLATHLYKKNITLEEYYQITPADEKITEPQPEIKDVEVDDGNEPQMTTAPTPNPKKKSTTTIIATPEPVKTKKPAAKKPLIQTEKVTSKPAATKKPKPTKKPEPVPATQEPEIEATPEPQQSSTPSQEAPAGEAPVSDTVTEESAANVQ